VESKSEEQRLPTIHRTARRRILGCDLPCLLTWLGLEPRLVASESDVASAYTTKPVHAIVLAPGFFCWGWALLTGLAWRRSY